MQRKREIQYFFQQLLGTDHYLFLTALYQWYVVRYFRPDKELDFFLEKISSEGVIIDVGANLGITSLLMEKKRPDCTIISFEPVTANLRCCKKMIRLFGKGRIHVHEKALSDSFGQLRMVQPTEKGVRMHGLSRVIDNDSQGNETFTVPATCLNDLPELQSPVNWVGLKIDVENFEWHVLRGGVEVIRKFRPLIYCEIWDIPEKERTLQLIREMGYSPFVWKKNKLEPYKAQTALNFYFLPD